MKTQFSPDWRHWIKTNIDNGQDKDYIFNLLIDEGYSYDSIKEEMQFEPTPKHKFTDQWLDWIRTNMESDQQRGKVLYPPAWGKMPSMRSNSTSRREVTLPFGYGKGPPKLRAWIERKAAEVYDVKLKDYEKVARCYTRVLR